MSHKIVVSKVFFFIKNNNNPGFFSIVTINSDVNIPFQTSILLDGPLARPHHGGHTCDRRKNKRGIGDTASEGPGAGNESGIGLINKSGANSSLIISSKQKK